MTFHLAATVPRVDCVGTHDPEPNICRKTKSASFLLIRLFSFRLDTLTLTEVVRYVYFSCGKSQDSQQHVEKVHETCKLRSELIAAPLTARTLDLSQGSGLMHRTNISVTICSGKHYI